MISFILKKNKVHNLKIKTEHAIDIILLRNKLSWQIFKQIDYSR